MRSKKSHYELEGGEEVSEILATSKLGIMERRGRALLVPRRGRALLVPRSMHHVQLMVTLVVLVGLEKRLLH